MFDAFDAFGAFGVDVAEAVEAVRAFGAWLDGSTGCDVDSGFAAATPRSGASARRRWTGRSTGAPDSAGSDRCARSAVVATVGAAVRSVAGAVVRSVAGAADGTADR
ncbi:hypothetical protein [Streptomyces niger]|uniref:hypothetical protein n=1 Tax=Streptomyces niger TaxID=66373 RepID=UPI000699D855|nr:hypothetical protein [Streptomyces niger]